MLPQKGLLHYLQLMHLKFCLESQAWTLDFEENPNHHVFHGKQQFHL